MWPCQWSLLFGKKDFRPNRYVAFRSQTSCDVGCTEIDHFISETQLKYKVWQPSRHSWTSALLLWRQCQAGKDITPWWSTAAVPSSLCILGCCSKFQVSPWTATVKRVCCCIADWTQVGAGNEYNILCLCVIGNGASTLMNRFNWTLFFFSPWNHCTHTRHLFFWVSIFIVFPVSLLAFLPFLTNPHLFPWHFSGVSSSHRGHHAGSRNAVHFSHDCWSTASCIADFSLHGRLIIILYLFLSSWSVFLLTSLAVHGKIKGNIPLQPPAAHYMRPLSTLHGTFCLLKQPAN